MKHVTLLFLVKDETQEVLLALKKRGFGAGKFNGTGGKVEAGETVPQAAAREAREELGVDVLENDLEHVGTIAFSFEEKPDWALLCTVFTATRWEGEPSETEEMAPQWFNMSELPYERMWVDDPHWLPQVLGGETLQASFHFSSDGSEVLEKKLHRMGLQRNRALAYGRED